MKTKGAIDKKRRRRRSDRNKRRKLYRKKPVKKRRKFLGRVIYPDLIRARKTKLKLWFVEELIMSHEGYMRFNPNIRHYMRKIVYKPRLRIDVDLDRISNRAKIEDLCKEYLWEGTWIIRGFSHGKTKTGCKPVKLCKVIISNHPSGVVARMVRDYRLHRYKWFYK